MPSPSRRQLLNLLLWLLPLLLTFALYWRALTFPFFWDDVANFDFATTRTFLQIWTNVSGFPYYRPILFTFWKIALARLPTAPTVLFHALNLAVHAANGILVGQVARILISRPEAATASADPVTPALAADLTGLLAAIFFVVYPMAAQPVSLVASLFHLVVTLVTLGAVLAALKFVRERKRGWLGLATLLTVIAPFVHEFGVMAGAVVALTLIIAEPRPAGRNKWLIGLFPLLSALFLPVWLAVPKTRGGIDSLWEGWAALFAKEAFFVQAPTFPFQLSSRLLINWFGWWDIAAIWIVAVLALLIAALVLMRRRRWQPLVLGVGWASLGMLPSVALLSIVYIVTSPRLLYYVGPGAALLWAAVCVEAGAFISSHRPFWRAALIAGLALVITIPPTLFVEREIRLHELALPQLYQLIAIAREHPGERPLLINGVNFLNYRHAWYVLGHEGVNVMAPYINFDELLYINSGTRTNFTEATFLPIKTEPGDLIHSTLHEDRPWDWATLAAQVTAYDRVWLTIYSEAEIRVIEAGVVKNNEAARPAKYLASFEDKVFLTGAQYHVADDEAVVTLEWKYLGPDPGATIFRHLFDCAGNVVGLGDGHALERMLPFTYLAPGAEVRDVRHVPLDARSADGCYYLEVGLFRADGARVTARAPDGSAFENAVVTLR